MRLFCLVFAATFLILPLHAQFLIDGFTDNSANLTPPPGPVSSQQTITTGGHTFDRTLTAGGSGITGIQNGTGWFMSASGDGLTSSLQYIPLVSLDLTSNPFLQLQIAGASGMPLLSLELLHSGFTQVTLATPADLSSFDNGGVYSVDVRTLQDYTSGFLNGVDGILLTLTGDSGTSIAFTQFQFAPTDALAVPEPSSYALAAIATLVLLAAAHRHARRNAACCQSPLASGSELLR